MLSDASYVIEVAIEAKSAADRGKLALALDRMAQEDPSFRAIHDAESGQTIIRAFGQDQLDMFIDRVTGEFGVHANIGAPQVAYRETLAGKATVDHTHKRQQTGTGRFARVLITVEPGASGQDVVFVDAVKGGNIPGAYIPAVEKGIRDIAATGALIGFPIVDFTVTLADGAYHDVDSSERAFEIAGREAMREAAQKAGIILLEPIMRVEIVTPPVYVPAIRADLSLRRAHADEIVPHDDGSLMISMVPLATMFGYAQKLLQIGHGRAQYTTRFDHYAPVPPSVLGPDLPPAAAAALRA